MQTMHYTLSLWGLKAQTHVPHDQRVGPQIENTPRETVTQYFDFFPVQSQHCSLGQGVGQLKESLARTPCVDGAKQPSMTNMGGHHQILNGSPRWFCKLTFLFWSNNKTYEAASNCWWQCVFFLQNLFLLFFEVKIIRQICIWIRKYPVNKVSPFLETKHLMKSVYMIFC